MNVHKNRITDPVVTLVCMPWTAVIEPSLGLGILKAKLKEAQIQARVFYGHIRLLKYMRLHTYDMMGANFALNDWLFTHVFEPGTDPVQAESVAGFARFFWEEKTFETYKKFNSSDDILSMLYRIRNESIPRYLDECCTEVLADNPTMVGFTCLFDQTIASLALARLIKQRRPEITTVMGGYALEGPLSKQIIDCFPFIDCVVTGEGEPAIVPLAQASVGKATFAQVPGAIYRENGNTVFANLPQPFINLNDSPFPDYDDFPVQLKQLQEESGVAVKWKTIPVEASRGCWWGQKSHCTFCGIDDHTMTYRKKKPERVLEMLKKLNEQYERAYFRFSDYILPNNYYNELLPMLAQWEHKPALSCEIKANITAEKARMLHEAGFFEVQPGIESFSTPVLRIMKKGVTAIQNIYTLLLGIRYSMVIHYNLLYGFPDETEEMYAELLKNIPKLYHLYPPENETIIALTRFAPLEQMFNAQSELDAHPAYDIIFSPAFLQRTGFKLNRYCYHFMKPFSKLKTMEDYYSLLSYQVKYWKETYDQREVVLIYEDLGDAIRFIDTRHQPGGSINLLNKACRDVFMMCELAITPVKTIKEQLRSHYTGEEIDQALTALDNCRVIFMEDDKVLGLALLLDDYKRFKKERAFRKFHPLESRFIDYEMRAKMEIRYEVVA